MERKKNLIGAGIICGLVITLSVSIYFLYLLPKSQNSDLALKEKCAQFVDKESHRFDEDKNSFIYGKSDVLIGVYFSKNLQTCISKWKRTFSYTPYMMDMEYYDILTDSNIKAIGLDNNGEFGTDADKTNKESANYEQSLNLIR